LLAHSLNFAGFKRIGKYVAIDCEMVGVGPNGIESALARVSIVNYHGAVLLDEYVRPQERVTDFRTAVSGILPGHIHDALPFAQVQANVAELLKDRIVVGHALSHDFKALLLEHPRRDVRDTSLYKPLRCYGKGNTPSLKSLVKAMLGKTVQVGQHDSVEDAQMTMLIFREVKNNWETELRQKRFKKRGKVGKGGADGKVGGVKTSVNLVN